jgi:hypothetical protein
MPFSITHSSVPSGLPAWKINGDLYTTNGSWEKMCVPSEEFCTLLDIPAGSYSHSDLLRAFFKYAKEKGLTRGQIIDANDDMRRVLRLGSTDHLSTDRLKILNLTRYLRPLYTTPLERDFRTWWAAQGSPDAVLVDFTPAGGNVYQNSRSFYTLYAILRLPDFAGVTFTVHTGMGYAKEPCGCGGTETRVCGCDCYCHDSRAGAEATRKKHAETVADLVCMETPTTKCGGCKTHPLCCDCSVGSSTACRFHSPCDKCEEHGVAACGCSALHDVICDYPGHREKLSLSPCLAKGEVCL